jgi:hypothetical protein
MALEAIRDVVEGQRPVDSLAAFANEHVRFPRIAGVTKQVRKQATVLNANG